MGKTKVVCTLPEAIDAFRFHYGVNLAKVIKYTMTSLIQTFIQLAPPKNKKQGVNSIDCDLAKVFISRKYMASAFSAHNAKEAERVKKYFRSNNYAAIQQMQNDGAIFNKTSVRIKPFAKADIFRNSRGRIYKAGKVIVTNPKALATYTKELKANVGKLKGSFIGALDHFGGGSYPGWIKKNTYGTFIDNTEPKQTLGIQEASAISKVSYGDSIDKRMNLVSRTYAVQAGKLIGAIKAGVLNKALTAYYGLPADTFTKK
jgi:hypothetical protein